MTATVPSMIGQFNMNNIQILQRMRYEVDVACDFNDRSVWTTRRVEQFKIELNKLHVDYFQVDYSRSPLRILKHIKSYQQLNRLVKERGYDFIHCHTPVASVISRIVAHENRVKIIYTAHGFHFYDGAPLKNWIIFYPVEKLFSRWTDVLITINSEDYERAKDKFSAGKVEYVPGVGIDTNKFHSDIIHKRRKREELKLTDRDIMILSVGELSLRKNHKVVIEALAELKNLEGFDQIRYFICGQGEQSEDLQRLANGLGIENNVHFLGYRTDIDELCQAADLFILPSLQEGLPVALMEAIATQTPVLCSDIRGNSDLIHNPKFLFDPKNKNDLKILLQDELKDERGGIEREKIINRLQRNNDNNKEIIKKIDIRMIECSMKKIYWEIGNCDIV